MKRRKPRNEIKRLMRRVTGRYCVGDTVECNKDLAVFRTMQPFDCLLLPKGTRFRIKEVLPNGKYLLERFPEGTVVLHHRDLRLRGEEDE